MGTLLSAEVMADLERHVQMRTNWRVRNLSIELDGDRAILRGQATTTFTRQLAQHVVQDFLPHLCLVNAIVVDDIVEVLLGVPMS